MKILVINCGSSSIKYKLFDMADNTVLASGVVERIGMDGSTLNHLAASKNRQTITAEIPNHKIAVKMVIDILTDQTLGVIKNLSEISAIGHRVLHGGEKFTTSVIISTDVTDAIEECIPMAPLHNPANLLGITACSVLMPNVPQVAVFDTAFHQTMPKHAYIYGLPWEAYEKYNIRRYGAHGSSHKYVSRRVAELVGANITDLRIITCHLGNGSSVAAVKYGRCIDTSMGLTPLEGLVMGTRCGDIDPAIIPFLMKVENFTVEQIDQYMNKKSGLLGISGISSDFRDIEQAAAEGNERARLAIDILAYRAKKYIGSYVAAMDGVDVIAFAGGLGENSIIIRDKICSGLSYLGTAIDSDRNNVQGKAREISVAGARVKIFVVPTDEELVIAQDTFELCKK